MTSQHGPFLPPRPAAPRQRNRVFVIAGVAVATVLVLCCGIGVAAVVGSGGAPSAITTSATGATPTRPSAAGTTATETTAPVEVTATPANTEDPATAAPATAKAVAKPRVIKGRGDDVVDIPPLTDIAVVVFDCRCTGNTVLTSDGPEGLLVNEIGSYRGKRWINVENDAQTTQFEIEASGRWTLTIGTVDRLARQAPSGKASGTGDDVVVLGGSATKARIKHTKGQANFVVEAYSLDTGQGGLLINEIGGYSGTRPLNAPALVQITADGTWSITPA
jgi:septal ring-binding cell division protein DamX